MRNNTVYVEPDIIVVCDESKMDEDGCHGAPDWIIEIISPGTEYLDCIMKLKIYADEGVKEYWVVDTNSKVVVVYDLENEKSYVHGFDKVNGVLFPDFEMDFGYFEKWEQEMGF